MVRKAARLRRQAKRKPLTQERLKELLHYDPETGLFTWLEARGKYVKAGHVAGHTDDYGYIRIGVEGRHQRAHRLAWLYMTGEWPALEIDHIDRDKTNNRWSNLREADRATNTYNVAKKKHNTSGFSGVSRSGGRWTANVRIRGRVVHLGCFDEKTEAAAAVQGAARAREAVFPQDASPSSPLEQD